MAHVTIMHPRMGHRLWVDDLSHSICGAREMLIFQMVECIKVTANSVIIVTSVQDTKATVRAVRGRGYFGMCPGCGRFVPQHQKAKIHHVLEMLNRI
eukprot:7038030-Pyramimonas_sp.AAC.1